MTTLSDLHIQDLRPFLNVIDVPACRRKRDGAVTSVTLHYNGDAVGGFGNPQRERKHVIEVDVPWQQTSPRIGGDSLMYHLVIFSDGSIWQSRDLELQAWHCGVHEGNEHSIAVHLPLGGPQDATPAQWDATTRLFEALIGEYHLSGRAAVKGHMEWKDTACPGPLLMSRLRAWRAGESTEPYTGGVLRIRGDVGSANVREGPGRQFPIALGGRAMMWPGDTLAADTIVPGEAIGGEARWAHRSDGLGFVHFSLLEQRV